MHQNVYRHSPALFRFLRAGPRCGELCRKVGWPFFGPPASDPHLGGKAGATGYGTSMRRPVTVPLYCKVSSPSMLRKTAENNPVTLRPVVST